jgi:hypothetical protein
VGVELHVARCEDSVHCCILLYIGERVWNIGFHDLPASSSPPAIEYPTS